VRLLYHAGTLQPSSTTPRDEREGDIQWQQSPWGKLLVGLLLAQGLCYGLHNLTLAGLAFTSRETSSTAVWQTLWGLFLSHSLQALSLIIGGALSGAGQRHGIWYGCGLGLANGILTLILQRPDQAQPGPLQYFIYALPLLHMVLGALGGLIGVLIWRPMPEMPLLEVTPAPNAIPMDTSLFSSQLLAGPLHPWRITAGLAVVVFGVGWSNAILQSVVDMTNGRLSVTSHLQAQLVSWEIAALAALLGAGFAGANTSNGLKQGLCVGVSASFIIATIQLAGPKLVVEQLVLTACSTVLLSVAGGWFGGQLFPPILQRRRRWSSYA
jgi:hypothetical protein